HPLPGVPASRGRARGRGDGPHALVAGGPAAASGGGRPGGVGGSNHGPVVAPASPARMGPGGPVPIDVLSRPGPGHAGPRGQVTPGGPAVIRFRPLRLVALVVALAAGLSGGAVVGFVAQGQPRNEGPAAGAPASPAPPPPVKPIRADTLLAWTPGGLPSGFAAGVAHLKGVAHAVAVESDILWLTRSYTADGAVADRPPRELAIPLEVAAASPAAYTPFLTPQDRSFLPALAKGQA